MSLTEVWAPDQISKSIPVLFPQLQNAHVTSPIVPTWDSSRPWILVHKTKQNVGDRLSACSLCHRCVPLSKGGGGHPCLEVLGWETSSSSSHLSPVLQDPSSVIFRLKQLVDCLPGCQTHVCPNDQIRGSPPSPSFISLPCFNQHFFCSSFHHTFHQFCSKVLFQRQNTKRDGFSGWWDDSGGSGELLTEVSVALQFNYRAR